jgi:hypothetical protein
VITAVEDTLDITRSFLSVALISQVVTGTFDTSQFEMALIFACLYHRQFAHRVISLLSLGSLNFILHCCMYSMLKMFLLFGAGFSLTKNMGRGNLVLYCLMF